MHLRYIHISIISSIALFFSLVAINNLVDFQSNWLFVQHVLSMDTTFKESSLLNRAIQMNSVQKTVYFIIIAWELLTALICWTGVIILLANRNAVDQEFTAAKKTAFIGLLLGFLLYMVGFITIGGEWFSMWQSPIWNGQMKSGLFLNFIMFAMIFLKD